MDSTVRMPTPPSGENRVEGRRGKDKRRGLPLIGGKNSVGVAQKVKAAHLKPAIGEYQKA